MRLIDVSDIEKFISENVTAIGDDHLLLVAGNDGRWHKALPFIKTAYSVDKVVKELEKQRNIIFQDTDSEIKIVRANAWDKIDVLNKAIEIVKQGGAYDDVCE